jgi:carbamoyltransferase
MNVLGIHGGVTINQHEPSAAIAVDGKIVAACEEERYLRVKSAYGHLPERAIAACLKQAAMTWDDIDMVVSPGATYADHAGRVRDFLRHTFGSCPKFELVHHQAAHLAAAFYGSGYDTALVLSLDATGDGSCGFLAHASRRDGISVLEEIPTKRSIGFFYTMMTHYLGFTDGDEYKVMGLAPYGRPSVDLRRVIRPAAGGWQFDFDFIRSDPRPRSPFEPLYAARLIEVLGRPNRRPGEPVDDFHRDVACSAQRVFEECLLNLVDDLISRRPGVRNLCFAGGVALNCSANRRLLYSGKFDNIYVPPAASDRGLAIGCAYMGAVGAGQGTWPLYRPDLGSAYADDAVRGELDANGIPFEETPDPAAAAAKLIAEGAIIGWYQGRSEIGARALGNRSVLAAASDPAMKEKVNARIKYREEFRPFAPAILHEAAADYFKTTGAALPFMCFTVDATEKASRTLKAVVHVDDTARVQTVRSTDNELFYALLKNYAEDGGVPAVLNTSFNLKGQPIVETPRDALMTFFGCGLDALVIGNHVVRKRSH